MKVYARDWLWQKSILDPPKPPEPAWVQLAREMGLPIFESTLPAGIHAFVVNPSAARSVPPPSQPRLWIHIDTERNRK